MLIFKLERVDDFLEATAVLTVISSRCHFKLSPAMFSLYVFHHSLRCNIALQIMPRFFTTYNLVNHIHHSSFFSDTFFRTLLTFQRIGCSSLTFALAQHLPLAQLPSEESCEIGIPLTLSLGERAATEIDYRIFVSIELQEFKPIARSFDQAPYVRITLTDSRAKFSYEDCVITLTKEGNQCIIGGVEAGDEVQLILTTIPMTAFSNINMIGLLKRVWIFKSNHNFIGVITAPIGLYARIFVYFPRLM